MPHSSLHKWVLVQCRPRRFLVAPNMSFPFVLDFVPPQRAASAFATLTSAQLNSVLHPTGSLTVSFETSDGTGNDGSFRVESFQIQSMLDYLNNQSSIRRLAEQKLTEARTDWLRRWQVQVGDIWSDSTFSELWLPCTKHNQFDGGGPQTRSMYILVFKVQWDEEHVTRTIKFRDDDFVSLGIEGD